jgi:tetratricopeptide (TPR) repeat protein
LGSALASPRDEPLNPELAEAHSSLGLIQLYYDWDFPEAERSLRRAFEINPNYATAYHWYSVLLMLDGRLDESMVYMRRAEELEPLWPNVKRALGSLYFRQREYAKAIEKCREALDLDPNLVSAQVCLTRSYEQKGLYQEAIAELQKVKEIATRQAEFTAMTARAAVLAGRNSEAKQLVKDLEDFSVKSHVPAYHLALAYAGLGDKEATLSWLEKALAERSVQILGLSGDPRFDLLHEDARFEALVRKLPALDRSEPVG